MKLIREVSKIIPRPGKAAALSKINKNKHIIMHIGMQKTGSTALQSTLVSARLSNFFYPSTARSIGVGHKEVFFSGAPDIFSKIVEEIPVGKVGIISHEAGYLCDSERIRSFGLPDVDLDTILVVRDPLPWMNSHRNQSVKSWRTSIDYVKHSFNNNVHISKSFQFSDIVPEWQAVSKRVDIHSYSAIGNVPEWFFRTYLSHEKAPTSVGVISNFALNREGLKVFAKLKSARLPIENQINACATLHRHYRGLFYSRYPDFTLVSNDDVGLIRESLSKQSDFLKSNFGFSLNFDTPPGKYLSLEEILESPLSPESESALRVAMAAADEHTR